LLVTGLIAYGSLYPFHYVAPDSFWTSFSTFLNERHLWTSRGDEVGNFALFVPLGATAILSLPRHASGWLRVAALFAGCTAFSLVTQVLQIYFPPRDAALADVLANASGAFAGMLGGYCIRHAVQVRLPGVDRHVWVALLVMAAWMTGDLWPFVPSIDFSAWKESVKPLFIAPRLIWGSVLFHLAAVYFVAELIASFVSRERVDRLVLLAVALVLVGKIVVTGQRVQPSFVLGSALGLLSSGAFRCLGRARLFGLLALLFATYTVRSLLPLQMRDEPGAVSWVPFASFLNGAMDVNALSLANSLYFFAGMLWLVARVHAKVLPVTVLLALWVAATELLQRWLVGHTSDITQPLLVILAGAAVRLAGVEPERATYGVVANRRAQ
jgi:VanZ family protein